MLSAAPLCLLWLNLILKQNLCDLCDKRSAYVSYVFNLEMPDTKTSLISLFSAPASALLQPSNLNFHKSLHGIKSIFLYPDKISSRKKS